MKYNKKNVDGYELIYSADWIHEIERLSHWSYYWHQASFVEKNFERTEKLLEIGVGTGFLANYLRSKGQLIQTLDIDSDKKPDICTDASGFDYSSIDLNGVLAFEVFEHIPFPLLKKLITQLSHSQVPKILFSVPWNYLNLINLALKIPFIPKIQIQIRIPAFKILTPAHHWELSFINTTLEGKELITEAALKKLFVLNNYECKRLNKVDNIQFYLATYKK